MKELEKTKLCPNCDGSVAMQVSICPYCGSSVFENNINIETPKNLETNQTLSPEETLASLYPPPYRPKALDTALDQDVEEEEKEEEDGEEGEEAEEEEGDYKSYLLPTILFFLGINILLFSVILLLFSTDGILYLKWKSTFWYVYSALAIPLLFFGYKGLRDIS